MADPKTPSRALMLMAVLQGALLCMIGCGEPGDARVEVRFHPVIGDVPADETEFFVVDEWNWSGPRGGPYRTRSPIQHGHFFTETPEDAQLVEAYLKWMTKRRYPDAGEDVIIFH